MLYFREHSWVRVNGASRFDAHIFSTARSRDDVHWTLRMRYHAGGAIWRRVQLWHRPEVWIEITSLRGPQRDWTQLAETNFWNLPDPDDDDAVDGHSYHGAGFLDVNYLPRNGVEGAEGTFADDHIWRVTGRDGRWFTVELAAFADGRDIFGKMRELPVVVMPDGSEERGEPDAEFWRRHAELYLVENVPFGMVHVQVPRNVKDPEAWALGRARQWVGVGEPEHIEVRDFADSPRGSDHMRGDIFVYLHFNAFYED